MVSLPAADERVVAAVPLIAWPPPLPLSSTAMSVATSVGAALQRGDELARARAVAVGVVPELAGGGVVDDAVVCVVPVAVPAEAQKRASPAAKLPVGAERAHHRAVEQKLVRCQRPKSRTRSALPVPVSRKMKLSVPVPPPACRCRPRQSVSLPAGR